MAILKKREEAFALLHKINNDLCDWRKQFNNIKSAIGGKKEYADEDVDKLRTLKDDAFNSYLLASSTWTRFYPFFWNISLLRDLYLCQEACFDLNHRIFNYLTMLGRSSKIKRSATKPNLLTIKEN